MLLKSRIRCICELEPLLEVVSASDWRKSANTFKFKYHRAKKNAKYHWLETTNVDYIAMLLRIARQTGELCASTLRVRCVVSSACAGSGGEEEFNVL